MSGAGRLPAAGLAWFNARRWSGWRGPLRGSDFTWSIAFMVPYAAVFIAFAVVPIIVMLGLSALLVWIIRRVWLADTREVMIALFTGFAISYLVLTIAGTAFRGHGMELHWPWQNPRFPQLEC